MLFRGVARGWPFGQASLPPPTFGLNNCFHACRTEMTAPVIANTTKFIISLYKSSTFSLGENCLWTCWGHILIFGAHLWPPPLQISGYATGAVQHDMTCAHPSLPWLIMSTGCVWVVHYCCSWQARFGIAEAEDNSSSSRTCSDLVINNSSVKEGI